MGCASVEADASVLGVEEVGAFAAIFDLLMVVEGGVGVGEAVDFVLLDTALRF